MVVEIRADVVIREVIQSNLLINSRGCLFPDNVALIISRLENPFQEVINGQVLLLSRFCTYSGLC